MSSNRVGYRGYVTSRPFGGLHIPVPVQALVLRDYCARNGYLYKLHANENVFANSYMVLEGMVNELDRYDPKAPTLLPAPLQPPLMRYAIDAPGTFFAEAVRAIRLALQRTLRVQPIKVVLVT